MPKTKRVLVSLGILIRDNGDYLIGQRRDGTDCAGKWEFPGGKIEVGESPEAALSRELMEEIGISVVAADMTPLMVLPYDYPHAKVLLHSYIICRWQGQPSGREGQQIAWHQPNQILDFDLLDAAYPLLEAARVFVRS